MIDFASPPGSYRAALEPGAFCAACHQSVCAHPDAIYQGVVSLTPAPVTCDPAGADAAATQLAAAARRTARGFPPTGSARAAGASDPPFHASGDSRVRQ